jgi:hypothetical protein
MQKKVVPHPIVRPTIQRNIAIASCLMKCTNWRTIDGQTQQTCTQIFQAKLNQTSRSRGEIWTEAQKIRRAGSRGSNEFRLPSNPVATVIRFQPAILLTRIYYLQPHRLFKRTWLAAPEA